ncbi:MAG TPA: nuclear transport factor 2 family protein [Candidatus Udaeobacter sp.]|nr:nuclear transport factor 2 family protein [Candidatus Udaeobacter sp.]
MKKQFTVRCVILIAAAPICFSQASPAKPTKTAGDEAVITNLEKSAWEAYKNKQSEELKKLLSKEYVGVDAEGIKNLDAEVGDMMKNDLRSYSLADVKVVFPRAKIAVITYKATTQGTSSGHESSGTYNSASLWSKQSGKWRVIFHAEIQSQ